MVDSATEVGGRAGVSHIAFRSVGVVFVNTTLLL